jgi:high-affinity nickel permease
LISLVATILLGFFLGMRHALDPDHVIAITTIVTRQGAAAKAALIGVMWGLGHTFTIFTVGAAIILFNVAIPPRLGLTMELAVGAMLVLLGVLNLTGVLQSVQNRFPGTNGNGESERPLLGLGVYNALRPLVVGIVHGLAGSAAVALLVLTTIREPWSAIAYLLVFGIGTIAGMVLITAVISKPFVHAARRSTDWHRGMTVASGVLSVLFGLFLAYQIGWVDGLFTSHPKWTPQ